MKLVFFALILFSSAANAYIGPGLGAGAIAAIFGILLAFFLAVVGFFYYPLKRVFKRLRAKKSEEKTDDGENALP